MTTQLGGVMRKQGWYYRLVKDAHHRPVSRIIKFGKTDDDADEKIRQAGYGLGGGQYLDMNVLHGWFASCQEAERDGVDGVATVLAVEVGGR